MPHTLELPPREPMVVKNHWYLSAVAGFSKYRLLSYAFQGLGEREQENRRKKKEKGKQFCKKKKEKMKGRARD